MDIDLKKIARLESATYLYMRGSRPRSSKGKRGRQGSWMISGGTLICVHPTCSHSGESQVTKVQLPNLLPRGGPKTRCNSHVSNILSSLGGAPGRHCWKIPPLKNSWPREEPGELSSRCAELPLVPVTPGGKGGLSPVSCQAEAGRLLCNRSAVPLYKHLGRYDPNIQPRVISNQEAKAKKRAGTIGLLSVIDGLEGHSSIPRRDDGVSKVSGRFASLIPDRATIQGT
ncbi:hypothetical protein BDV26DRAFT_128310 [Aspergillus bertholletiae]|uniref:Uncharacterized protein n=1 Tax=Aspergillus bertholletiae TaxID=1226010 RepID=A0A5N7BFV8_9EURO|nr:hypothetical protein BDV26DRAFT_128310 [Aspergillus bertholletiae]